ncbi:RNA polymerase sigma-70 factor [Flagellimonas sp. HMM57]|uniref:RNA polymerase sigma factor n=1 Tax=unclassified Flagellimonas TaxID=2644544 RepID=UPI0013D412F3|nr:MULTISPECIES: RNA polymerase sigma-70 factor [unclassified Flagellimonas]UII76193.1 RNA polymerase sigma-70 factor [Flagellimonas sp. HMM57]
MTERELHKEQLLVKKLSQGDEKAFRELFDGYRNQLYRFSLGMLSSEAYAKEMVQEVFLKVWTKRESLNPELSFRSYLFTITRNKNIKFLKKAANNLKLREEIFYRSQKSANTTEKYMREADLEVLRQKALDQLPPKRRIIFEMSRNEGKSYETIGQELGISTSTVKSQMSKALETLRNFILENKDINTALVIMSLSYF